MRDANLKTKENLRLITVYVCSAPETIFLRVAILALFTYNIAVYISYYLDIYIYMGKGAIAQVRVNIITNAISGGSRFLRIRFVVKIASGYNNNYT